MSEGRACTGLLALSESDGEAVSEKPKLTRHATEHRVQARLHIEAAMFLKSPKLPS